VEGPIGMKTEQVWTAYSLWLLLLLLLLLMVMISK
jgi:hypothetical protein